MTLLDRIESHLINYRISATRFGRRAVGDPRFVLDLRLGRRPRRRTLERLVEAEHAGRAYAAYGGIYILSALGWLWMAEGVKPDRWDAIGVAVCLVGASIILWGPRTA